MTEIQEKNRRHRCTHNERTDITYGNNEPNSSSEYSKVFVPHAVERRQPIKPVDQSVREDGVIDGRTTNRLDYVSHPWEKPYERPKDTYKAPDGNMDMSTNYSQQYTQKPFEKAVPIRPQEQSKLSVKFDGNPTYAADYRQWDVARHQKAGPNYVYQPPSDPFVGNSNYKADYPAYSGASPRHSKKPNNGPRISDGPFDGTSETRQSYVKHPMEPGDTRLQPNRNKPVYLASTAPLDDMSNYRMDYTQKDASTGKQASCRPDATPFQSEAPFEGGTTNKADFVGWPTERIQRRKQASYEKPVGNMDMTTTTNMDYSRKPLEAKQPQKMSYSRHVPAGKFDGSTSYKNEYLQWSPGERTQPMKKEQYVPTEGPFEGQPTYRQDYIKHDGATMTRSLKPPNPGYSSNAPLEDGTEYRKQYTGRKTDPCLAHQLLSASNPADHGFELDEKDDKGHVWYRHGLGSDTTRG